MTETCDVAIIGAGPAGAVAASLLSQLNRHVVVLEQSQFPRFSIGESLLPQCMEFLQQANMLEVIDQAGFQPKFGAAFARDDAYSCFDFSKKFSPGPGSTYQVQRAKFDKLLADRAAELGADIRYGIKIDGFQHNEQGSPVLSYSGDASGQLQAKFVLDASGFGRVLSRLLNLETPSDMAPRTSLFTHIEDGIQDPNYDRGKILISIHPQHEDIWYWLIPFENGRASLGVVGHERYFAAEDDHERCLKSMISACPQLAALLSHAKYDTPVSARHGYSCNVSQLAGPGYALLGNAAEFLDPVFSSGITIAMKSATLAAPLVDEHLKGNEVDWDRAYSQPLKSGVDTFRAYVNAWYRGEFQDVVFSDKHQTHVRAMICSILAGYAWDQNNPYVKNPARLQTLVEICRG